MKRSEGSHDFSQPTRQSLVAILMIIIKTYRIIIRSVWPFLLLFLFRGESSGKNSWILYLVVAALLGMVYSIINYFRYYFYLEKDELVIESGVLKRSKLNVPFDRIQTINFEQNIIHRVFNVVRLKIDTAGSGTTEFKFQAIDSNTADELRNLLLAKRKMAVKPQEEDTQEEKKATLPQYKTIMQLSLEDLIKAGAVENHLRSGGIILAFMYWIWQSLDDAQINIEDQVESTVMSTVGTGLYLFFVLGVIFVVLSFIVSMVKTEKKCTGKYHTYSLR